MVKIRLSLLSASTIVTKSCRTAWCPLGERDYVVSSLYAGVSQRSLDFMALSMSFSLVSISYLLAAESSVVVISAMPSETDEEDDERKRGGARESERERDKDDRTGEQVW